MSDFENNMETNICVYGLVVYGRVVISEWYLALDLWEMRLQFINYGY